MEILSPILVPAVQRSGSITIDANLAGQTVVLTSASAITVTVPAGLPLGFAMTLIQGGAGVITYAAGTGATIRNINGHTKSGGQYSLQSIIMGVADNPILAGQTAA